MLDIRKDFMDSYETLKKHREIVIPLFLAVILPMLLIFIFINLSGIDPVVREYLSLSKEFDNQKKDYILDTNNIGSEGYSSEVVNYLEKDSEDSAYQDEFDAYLESKGFGEEKFKALFTMDNLILLITLVGLGIVGSFYLSCMSFAIIALSVKGKDTNAQAVLGATNRFFLKLLSLRVLVSLLIIGPLLVAVALIVSMFFVHWALGVLSVLLLLIVGIIYFIYVSLRLFFVSQSMFLEDKGPVESLKNSYRITRGHIWQVVVVSIMVYGVSVFSNSLVSQPLNSSLANVLFWKSPVMLAINVVILLLMVTIEATLFAFEHIFIFYSYLDLKHLEEVTK